MDSARAPSSGERNIEVCEIFPPADSVEATEADSITLKKCHGVREPAVFRRTLRIRKVEISRLEDPRYCAVENTWLHDSSIAKLAILVKEGRDGARSDA